MWNSIRIRSKNWICTYLYNKLPGFTNYLILECVNVLYWWTNHFYFHPIIYHQSPRILLKLSMRYIHVWHDYKMFSFFITGYRQCPVRLQLSNATPVSITLSTSGVQYPASATNKSNPSCHSLRQGHC